MKIEGPRRSDEQFNKTGDMTSQTKKTRSRELKYILASAGLHLVMLLVFIAKDRLPGFSSPPSEKPVEITFVEINQTTKFRQIVESGLVEKTKTPEKDAYLGAQNQRVRKQTRAEKTGAHLSSRQAGRKASGTSAKAEGLSLKSLGIARNMAPTGHMPPGSASSDYVRDVEQGAQTLLNTREYLYFSYYQRVRRQLEQFWEPNLRARLKKFFAKGRSLASDKEHSTRLLVHLDGGGAITKIEVQDTSGLFELDQAAIDAFNKAGPFPNPPRGMLEASNGAIKVEWEFVLRT